MLTLLDIEKIDNITINTYSGHKWVHDDNYPNTQDYSHYTKWVDLSYPESKHIYFEDLTEIALQNTIDNTPIDELFIMSKYLQYGDYDNSCMVERSNVKLFLEEYGNFPGVFEVTGGYGSVSIAISLKWLLNPDNEDTAREIVDILNGLSDYPCIDDEDMSNMEYEAFYEALDDYGIKEFIDKAGNKFNLDISDYDVDKTKEIILEIDRNLNYPCYMIESGGICYIDIDRLIEPLTIEQLKTVLADYEVVE